MKDDYCIKDPNNHGITCESHSCEQCGWNPVVAKRRKAQREKSYELNVPVHCIGCILVKMCMEAGCIKQGCSHKKTSYVNSDDITAEMKDRQ